jgi:integrase
VFNYEQKTSGLLRINPASGLMLKDKRRKDTLREAFSIDDLRALFVMGKGYREDKFRQPPMFWAPLISLYSGCRLEECSQLFADQIRAVGGVMCMVIDEEHEDQSVKTAEKREVPLHPFLLDLGLHRYAQELPPGSRLWPGLKRVGNRYSHYLSKWFGTYKKACGLGKKVTFHNFRGTVETELREQDVDPTWIDIY